MGRMRGATTAGLLIGMLWASLAGAQTPNFSGTWEAIDSADAKDPEVLTVTQTKDTLIARYAVPASLSHNNGVSVRSVYKTDGSENHSTLMDVESAVTVTSKNGQLTLVSVSKYPDGRIRETTQVWSLDAGGNLVIETRDGLRGEAPESRKQVYRRDFAPAGQRFIRDQPDHRPAATFETGPGQAYELPLSGRVQNVGWELRR